MNADSRAGPGEPIGRIIVLGGGSAGFLAALALKTKLPEIDVTIIRSKDIGIIGVGEGTTPHMPWFLFGYLGLDQKEFHRLAEPTWKLGVKFLWGPRPYFNYTFTFPFDKRRPELPKPNGYYLWDDLEFADPWSSLMTLDRAFLRRADGMPDLEGRSFGYHIENEKFVGYLEHQAEKTGVRIVDDTVTDVRRDDDGITGLQLGSGGTCWADLYVDCSGFRSIIISKTFAEPFLSFKSTLFCDRAMPGGWARTDEPIKPYTTAETMNAGWCWQIEHEHRIIRGYVYSSDFISDEAAERELREKNPKIGPTRVVKFPPGRYRHTWVQNVVGIGNASGFVEPLEATSLLNIGRECHLLTELLISSDRRPSSSCRALYNKHDAQAWDEIRDFLGVHYRYNTRLDTEFWKACRHDVDIGEAQAFVEFYRENGPSLLARRIFDHNQFLWGMDGYLTLLVGQCVSYQRPHQPARQELETWNAVRERYRSMANSGVDIAEALAAVRSPAWKWDAETYRRPFQPPFAPE